MNERKSKKTGWLVGWSGSFLWLCLLSIVWLVQGKIVNGLLGISLFSIAIFLIVVLAPWKHPETKYWKLMSPIYAVLIVSVSLSIWFAGGLKNFGLSLWSILWLMPCFLPLVTTGIRCWNKDHTLTIESS